MSKGFIRLSHDLLDSEAWQQASLGCRGLVLAIWRRHNGKNNGSIPFGRRDARVALHCGPNQAVRYLKEAQERGFIVAVRRGSLGDDGVGKATRWRLTMERCEGNEPSLEFLKRHAEE
jgi:hypothetical protein